MLTQEHSNLVIPEREVVKTNATPFIEANTKDVSLSHLSEDCVIPVFSKDNEMTISHQEFVEAAQRATNRVFGGETIAMPEIRISHIVKGRVPSAIGKPVKELLASEKTLYYERMMFAIEVPSIYRNVDGNQLTLTLGGVRAYNQENLYSKKSPEKFKFFVGFKNMVCCNMCVSSDGFAGDIRTGSAFELENKILSLLGDFQLENHFRELEILEEYHLSETQFAQFLGKSKLYHHLPKKDRLELPSIRLNEGQISNVAKQYYEDENFSRCENGKLPIWNFYNLLTGANKSSYIDTFLDRSVNSFEIARMLARSLEYKSSCWYLN